MVMTSFKQWCCTNIIWPGAVLFDFNETENFPFIEAWINTMCPRIEEDMKVLNLEDLNSYQ